MRFLIATRNPKKLKELSRILNPLGIEAVSAAELGIELDETEETGKTFEENAELKALAACRQSGLPAVADDSGLDVDALGGAPGVHSARFAGEKASDAERNAKLLSMMEGIPEEKRAARFVCAICCVLPSGEKITACGECAGKIGFNPIGDKGFGYDPVFVVSNGKTFAQLSDEEKDLISHRGRALRQFSARLLEYLKKTRGMITGFEFLRL